MNDLSDLREESVSIQTSAGALRLYPQRFEDIGAFSKLSFDDAPARRLRTYLPQIATHDADPAPDRQRDAVDEDFCQRLSDEDMERIAEVYLSVPAVRRAAADAALRPGALPRTDAETSTDYLDRVLRAEHERQMEDLGATYTTFRERYGAPLSSALGDLDKQAAQLKQVSTVFIHGHEVAGHEHVPTETRSIEIASVANGSAIPGDSPIYPPPHLSDAQGADGVVEHATIARRSEREAEIELTRNIGWMTAQSANLLAKLSESATQFLRQFADAAASSDAATRRTLRVAVGGIVVAALFSAAALAIAVLTFLEQRERQQADARWQASVAQNLKDNAAAADDRFKATNAKLQQLAERQNAIAALAPAPVVGAPTEPKDAATASHKDVRPTAARTGKRKANPSRQ